MIDKVTIDASVEWLVTDTESGYYVAFCEGLTMATQGETWSQLMQNIGDAMSLLFLSLLIEGEIDEFFSDRGWTKPPGLEVGTPIDMPFIAQQVDNHAYTSAALHQ